MSPEIELQQAGVRGQTARHRPHRRSLDRAGEAVRNDQADLAGPGTRALSTRGAARARRTAARRRRSSKVSCSEPGSGGPAWGKGEGRWGIGGVFFPQHPGARNLRGKALPSLTSSRRHRGRLRPTTHGRSTVTTLLMLTSALTPSTAVMPALALLPHTVRVASPEPRRPPRGPAVRRPAGRRPP